MNGSGVQEPRVQRGAAAGVAAATRRKPHARARHQHAGRRQGLGGRGGAAADGDAHEPLPGMHSRTALPAGRAFELFCVLHPAVHRENPDLFCLASMVHV